jgi:hypothetical protein
MFCRNCGAALPDQSRYCESCGTAARATEVAKTAGGPSSQQIEQIKRGGKRSRFGQRFGIGVIVIGVLVLVWVLWSGDNGTPSTAARTDGPPSTELVPPTQSSIPPSQQAFRSLVESFMPQYRAAETEVRKTNVRFQRKDAIVKYFSGSTTPSFEEWAGELRGLTTESDGAAYVSVKLEGSDIYIKTWNNSLSDIGAHTMISRNDQTYQSLMDLKEGDEVIVSGAFIVGDGGPDYVKEGSLTEEGSMTSPEFIVRFSEIRKEGDQGRRSSASSAVTEGPHRDWHVVSIQSSVTRCKVDQYPCPLQYLMPSQFLPIYRWKLTIRNDADEPADFSGQIDFKDAGGAILQSATYELCSLNGGTRQDAMGLPCDAAVMRVPSHSEADFSGYASLQTAADAQRATRAVANICPYLVVRVQLPPLDTSPAACEHFENNMGGEELP